MHRYPASFDSIILSRITHLVFSHRDRPIRMIQSKTYPHPLPPDFTTNPPPLGDRHRMIAASKIVITTKEYSAQELDRVPFSLLPKFINREYSQPLKICGISELNARSVRLLRPISEWKLVFTLPIIIDLFGPYQGTESSYVSNRRFRTNESLRHR